jgi:hypothetical protein
MPDPINPRTEFAIDFAALPQDRREAVANLSIFYGGYFFAEVCNFLLQSHEHFRDINSSSTDTVQQELVLKQLDLALGFRERLEALRETYLAAMDAAVNFGGTKQ